MISLLIDVNLDGHAERLLQRLHSNKWLEYYELLELHILFFEDVGLNRHDSDVIVWRFCQEHGYWLLTANRNKHDNESLEAVIHQEGTVNSIPVLTLANAPRMLISTAYLDKIIDKLLNILFSSDAIRGSGRLFLP